MEKQAGRTSDSNLHKRLLAIIGISLLLISIIFALCWLAMHERERPKSNACLVKEDSKLASQMSEMDQIKMPSPDFRTLVRLNGFLSYSESLEGADDGGNLPLKLHDLSHSEGQNGESQLTLSTGCARLVFNLASDSKQLIVGSIDVSTVRVGEHRRECQVTTTSIRLEDLTSARYLCNSPAKFDCKSSFWHNNDTYQMRKIATLELNSLEFEVDGDPTVIRTNQFSKQAAEC